MGCILSKSGTDELEIGNNTPVVNSVYNKLLIQYTCDIRTIIDIKPLQAYLQKYSVVDDVSLQQIMAAGPEYLQVEALIRHVRRGSVGRFCGFMKALKDSNQTRILDILEIDHDTYLLKHIEEEEETSLQTGLQEDQDETILQKAQEEAILEGIRKHCESYDRNILTIPQFDFLDEVHDIKSCLIPQNILLDKGGQKRELVHIPEDAIFKEFEGNTAPRTVLLSGAVGQGKSTFIRSFISKWSEQQIHGPTKKEMMIFIPAISITGDILQSIKANIFCTGKKQDLVYNFVTSSDCEGVYIFIDGIDEVRDEAILTKIGNFVEERKNIGGPVVLVTTRDNLAGVNLIHFNRHLQIQRLDTDQGLEYVRNYVGVGSALLRYMEKEDKTEEIASILKNPLRFHILSVLYKRNMLQIEDLPYLRISHLYKYMDELVTKREVRKRKTPADIQKRKRFYKMCLYSMLKGKVAISEDLLKKFQVDETCPMMRLLLKSFGNLIFGEIDKYIYTAPHESYLEYWCAQGILSLDSDTRKLILLYLCSKKEWTNIMLMAYGLLALEDDSDKETQLSELCTVIRYMIVLLLDESTMKHDPRFISWRRKSHTLMQRMKILTTKVDRDGVDKLYNLLMDENTFAELKSKAVHCDKEINNWFDRDYKHIRDQAWLSALYKVPDPFYRTIQTHIHRCLEQSLPDQLEHVTDNTLGLMLPCKDKDKSQIFYHVKGKARWASFNTSRHICLAWCPSDALSHNHRKDRVVFNCNEYRHIFDDPPKSSYSQSSWEELLKVASGNVGKKIVVELDKPVSPKFSSDVRNHLLPILKAVSSSYSHLCRDNIEQVSTLHGYILLSELRGWLEGMNQKNSLTVELVSPSIVLSGGDGDAENIPAKNELNLVKKPQWFKPNGEQVKRRDPKE